MLYIARRLFRKERQCGSLVLPRAGTVQEGRCLSTAAGTVQEGQCLQQGDRENQWSQRLRMNHNLPSYQFSVKRAKATQQPPQGMWQSRGPWGLSHRLVNTNICSLCCREQNCQSPPSDLPVGSQCAWTGMLKAGEGLVHWASAHPSRPFFSRTQREEGSVSHRPQLPSSLLRDLTT